MQDSKVDRFGLHTIVNRTHALEHHPLATPKGSASWRDQGAKKTSHAVTASAFFRARSFTYGSAQNMVVECYYIYEDGSSQVHGFIN